MCHYSLFIKLRIHLICIHSNSHSILINYKLGRNISPYSLIKEIKIVGKYKMLTFD